MSDKRSYDHDVIDEDLYEDLDEEELLELVEEERRKSLATKEEEKKKRPFPKWAFWLIAIAMFINVIAIIPRTFSIPAVDFLLTSAELSQNAVIQEDQQAVVVVEAGNSKGTGFSVSEDGYIITNHHVIENGERVSIAFPEAGLFQGEVVAEYEDIDLAVLKAKGVKDKEAKDLPYLPLAEKTEFTEREPVHFIGNPLRFSGIANNGEVIGYTTLDNWDKQVLMLDAPIYRGNSGSPVINEQGNVIAVVFATIRNEEQGKVGLAVPITYLHEATKGKDLWDYESG
ncbi:S1C family serine protease [Pontibacillus salicampi]|uniref:S1C family serine protease n=1 Tax=Pontibacillus salicampi TaxID=1449801 RepID=A0ABV6LLU0_9BACI